MLEAATIPISAACVLAPVVVAAVSESENPYVTLGVAGVLLAVIVVPTFRWLMSRVDRQQDQQEKLIAALQESVDQNASVRDETRRGLEQMLVEQRQTNSLLQTLQRNTKD